MFRLVVPLIYTILVGIAWAMSFKKSFLESLAPALMFHILVTLISGMLIHRLLPGIVLGVVLAVAAIVFYILHNREKEKLKGKTSAKEFPCWKEGLSLYILLYLFCFFTNYGKRFIYWDEYSHWGLFLKEQLRLDVLYCMSPIAIAHKDYVPAVTIFETIYCRMSGGFAEDDAYRAVQILTYAMMMPLCRDFIKAGQVMVADTFRQRIRNRLYQISPMILVLLVTLLLRRTDLSMYHTLYCDLVVGIMLFYCAYIIIRDDETRGYECLILSISFSVLVLSKQISYVFFLMALCLLVARDLLLKRKELKERGKYILPVFLVPTIAWASFNHFAEKHLPDMSGMQSYSGMDFGSIFDVLFNPSGEIMEYLPKFRTLFLVGLININIMQRGSYLMMLAMITLLFLFAGYVQEKQRKDICVRNKDQLLAAWYFLFGIAYIVLMYWLYLTAFSKEEAERLASFERYMATYIICGLMLLLGVYFDSGLWKEKNRAYNYLLATLLFYHMIFHPEEVFHQFAPGFLTGDGRYAAKIEDSAHMIDSLTSETDKIYFMEKNSLNIYRLRYYESPKEVGGPGVALEGGYAITLGKSSPEEFALQLRDFDYIYFGEMKEKYKDMYYSVLAGDEPFEGGFYRITEAEGQTALEYCSTIPVIKDESVEEEIDEEE